MIKNNNSAPKVLFISSIESDYMQDTVFVGLVDLLGIENVYEYPFNLNHHFNRRQYPRNLGLHTKGFISSLKTRLFPKSFDLVIIGSAKPETFSHYLKVSNKISTNVPIVFVDGGDRPEIGGDLDRLGRYDLYQQVIKNRPFDFVFKREYLENTSYPNNVIPFPFGLNPFRLDSNIQNDFKYDVSFWAVESDPIRTKALQSIENKFDCANNGTTRNQTFRQYVRKGQFYLDEIRRCKIVLNFRGVGWDTLRYWEVPGLGRMMISQKPKIVIPNNFENKLEAIYCKDDLSDLIDLCEYYLQNESEREKISKNAHAKFLNYHTHLHRAKQIIDTIFQN